MTSDAEWAKLQQALTRRIGPRAVSDLEQGTIVVIPSITFPVVELDKIIGAQRYEERTLFLALLLARPGLELVFVTSLPVDPAIVDYYLRFLPDADDARSRLHLVTLDDRSSPPLSEKLLSRPEVLARVRALAADPAEGCVVTFNVTPLEVEVCRRLGLPLYGPDPALARLGSKSGARQVARQAGVAVLDGAEDLFSIGEVGDAARAIRARRPEAEAVVVKLNHGFSGQGSVMVDLAGAEVPFTDAPTLFCAPGESWPGYSAKVAAEGAIVEELVRVPGTVSPSVQIHVSPSGSFEVVSTHDQLLGGPGNQVYVGCRFPAHASYRLAIQEDAVKVAEILAAAGVVGSFGIDFLVVPGAGVTPLRGPLGPRPRIYLTEINLRMGGTTHPFWMARLATGGAYDVAGGALVAGGTAKAYVATDNFKSPSLVGRSPASVIAAVDDAGLGFDPVSATGATLHLLGAVPDHGKVGATCIADSPAAAEALYQRVAALLVG
ncbi:MAG: hypothetical protein H0T70_06810 [Acidimicrobiia bacterium]|nr:hypothetical protein [Acidimicrobiia bacterium]